MSFVSVNFGYNQTRIFATNCQIAALMDAIHQECFKDMKHKLEERQEFFGKEINAFKKEQAQIEKKIEKLEVPVKNEQPPPPVVKKIQKRGPKKIKTKKELEKEKKEAEQKAKEEEEARILKEKEEAERKIKEEEERKKKEEEEAKAAKEKKGKGGKGKNKVEEEEVQEVVEETPEQKIEKEKAELKAKVDVLKAKIDKYQAKVKLCQEDRVIQDTEETRKKITDLVEKTSQERKYLKATGQDYANTVLGERRAYIFTEVVKNPTDENADDEAKPIKINGAACRTPAEDLIWEQEQRELEANPPKTGKQPAKGKKK